MWGALLGAVLSLHTLFPHPYVHATHAAWYLLRSALEETPHVRFGSRHIPRVTQWYNWIGLACVSCATALPTPNMLDYTWTPYLVFAGNGFSLPTWMHVVQGAFFAGYAHVRPEAVFACTVVAWKHVHTTKTALWFAAAAHAVLACFEPGQDPSMIFLSILTAECKYRVSQSPCQHVFEFWCVSLLAMTYELRLAVWATPTLACILLGTWSTRWQYTDQVSAWGCGFVGFLLGFQGLL